MKPCPQNKERIVWLETGVLEPEQIHSLRDHLETCAGCRAYAREIAGLTLHLNQEDAVATAPDHESFHRRLVHRIRADECEHALRPARGASFLPPWLTGWRTALATSLGVLVLTTLILSQHSKDLPRPFVPSPTPWPVKWNPKTARPATLGAYRSAANVSLDALDQWLNEQATQSTQPMEHLSLSSVVRMDGDN